MWVGCFLTALAVVAVVEGSDEVLHGRGQTCPGHCGLAVVGAGAGGAYAAWRVAKDNGASVAAKDVCVFERSERVGGECVCGVRALKDLTLPSTLNLTMAAWHAVAPVDLLQA